jgi:ABC-type cobalamin/Fe3+-siderophores transport system ATPase subunit
MADVITDPVIRMENVVVSYRESVALHGVSLTVSRGEFVAIIGPNGAGKTTLLTVVNGLAHVLQGRVRVLGHDINGQGRHELRKRVGYVAQVPAIDKRMPVSAREVVMIGRYGLLGLFRRPSLHDWQKVDESLEMVGMSHLAGRPIGHLSGGEQQRIAIARCLAQEPGIFLLDEPTASLDWKAQTEILQLVRRIHDERQLTTLFVTHDLDALPHTCDRVVLVKEGSIVGDGLPDRVISTASVSRLFNLPVDVVEEQHPHVHPREH